MGRRGGQRTRRFRVVSQTLTRDAVVHGLDRPNVERYAGIVHDKDQGVRKHVHVIFALRDARSYATVANMLQVPTELVRPVVGQRGDPHSFARAVRYLTHESPTEQAKGKHLYADGEVFASPGYDWRAEVDALRAHEGHIPPLLDRLRVAVLRGERSARSIFDEYPQLFVRHHLEFERLDESALREYATPELRAARVAERRQRTRGVL
ncbi:MULTISPECIES: Rep family protein [unclassified Curtobacterium]|nr:MULTISPECIES: Rep family protein [unclassified Curtobacterium]WIB01783.1 Rep family protein [Curtobacterium sp. MCBA15_012]